MPIKTRTGPAPILHGAFDEHGVRTLGKFRVMVSDPHHEAGDDQRERDNGDFEHGDLLREACHPTYMSCRSPDQFMALKTT